MAYFHACPRCGASLDLGERRDCQESGDEDSGGYQLYDNRDIGAAPSGPGKEIPQGAQPGLVGRQAARI